MDPDIVVPPPAAEAEFAKLSSDTLADIVKEFNTDSIDEQIGSLDAPSDTEQPVVPVETKPEVPVVEVTKTEPVPPQELQALIARELDVRDRETALAAREAALKEAQAPGDLIARMRTDPEQALKDAGVDVDHAVRLIIAKRLGDKAPPELRAALRDAEIQAELNALRSHNESMRQAETARQFYTRVSDDAKGYVTTGLSKDVPALAEVAKDTPDWVHGQIMDEITRDAQVRLSQRDPSDKILSFADAAKRLEKRLAPVLKGTKPAASTTEATKTAGAAATQTKPATPAKPVGSPKPLLPWQTNSDQDLLDAGLKAALMEFKRAEAEGKSRV